MTGKPYAQTKLVKFLKTRILELRPKKTQAVVASEAGFLSLNMLANIKRGSSKLPIDRVPALAKALDTDPALLLRLALEQAEGDIVATVLIEIFGEIVTQNERAWIAEIRSASDKLDPSVTAKARSAIRGVFGK